MPCVHDRIDVSSEPYGDTYAKRTTHECEYEGPDDPEATKYNAGDCPCEFFEEAPTREEMRAIGRGEDF